MMRRLPQCEYGKAVPYIDAASCGAVYPLSVAEGTQQGEIYIHNGSVLIRHFCGFAFIFGEPDDGFAGLIHETFLSERADSAGRFILFAPDESAAKRFLAMDNVSADKRYFFGYPQRHTAQSAGTDPALPPGFSIRPVDETLYGKLRGRVTPSVFWRQPSEFFANGAGFCAVRDGEPCAWAFSAAVGGEEIDIGVETAAEYRHLGLAAAAAGAMIKHVLSLQKRPVWACARSNAASGALAEKLGFVRSSECVIIKRADR